MTTLASFLAILWLLWQPAVWKTLFILAAITIAIAMCVPVTV